MGGALAGFFRRIVGILVCVGLSGCTSLVVAALPIHKGPVEMPDDIKQLCETEAGIHVYEDIRKIDSIVSLPTIEIVDNVKREYGGSCRPCFGAGSLSLNDDPPQLPVKEQYFSEPEQAFYPKPLERQGNGYYRYEIVGRPSSRCEPFDDMMIQKGFRGLLERSPQALKEALEDSCVVAFKIDKPTSPYSLQRTIVYESRRYQGNAARIRRSTYELRRRSDGTLVARQTYFSFALTGFVNNPTAQCPVGQFKTLAQAFLSQPPQ